MIAMIMAPSIEAPGILVTWLSIPPIPLQMALMSVCLLIQLQQTIRKQTRNWQI